MERARWERAAHRRRYPYNTESEWSRPALLLVTDTREEGHMTNVNDHRRAVLVAAVIVAVVATGFVFSLNYHVVTTSRGTFVVPKRSLTLVDTFVDVRGWGWSDLWTHRETVVALVQAGHGAELPQVERFTGAVRAGVQTLQEFDARYGISDKIDRAARGVQEFDEKHRVSERVQEGIEKAASGVRNLMQRARER